MPHKPCEKALIKEAQRTFRFSIVSSLVAISFLFHASSDRYSAGVADYGFSPVFFPEILLFLWLGLSLLLAVKTWISIRVLRSEMLGDSNKLSAVRPMLCFSLSVAYAVLMLQVGFLFSSILFCISFIRLFGYKRWSVAIPISIIFPIVVWYVFNFGLHVPLPVSPWFSRI